MDRGCEGFAGVLGDDDGLYEAGRRLGGSGRADIWSSMCMGSAMT